MQPSDTGLWLLGFAVGIPIGVLLHELGHLAAAIILKLRVVGFHFGSGKEIWSGQIRNLPISIGWKPLAGSVKHAYLPAQKNLTMFLFVAAGPAVNLLLGICLWTFGADLEQASRVSKFLNGSMIAQVWLFVVSLVPSTARFRGNPVDTDGKRLWQLLTHRNYAAWQLHSLYSRSVARYCVESSQQPNTTYRISDGLVDVLSTTAGSNYPAYVDKIERLLASPSFSNHALAEQRLHLLDAMATTMLLGELQTEFGDWRKRLEVWLEAVSSPIQEPDAIKHTRMGVLVELGRFNEAEQILREMDFDKLDTFSKCFALVYSARIQLMRGDAVAATASEKVTNTFVKQAGLEKRLHPLITRMAEEFSVLNHVQP